MKTNIEDYLKQNRASLDVENPDDDFIWSGIQDELKTKKIETAFPPNSLIIVLSQMFGNLKCVLICSK